MKTRPEIEARLAQINDKLRAIDTAMQHEMHKVFTARDKVLLTFLYKEKSVYAFAQAQLAWVLEEEQESSRCHAESSVSSPGAV